MCPEPVAGASGISPAAHFHGDRFALIAKTAYRFAQERQFAPGDELNDWLAAEKLVDFRLIGEGRVFLRANARERIGLYFWRGTSCVPGAR